MGLLDWSKGDGTMYVHTLCSAKQFNIYISHQFIHR